MEGIFIVDNSLSIMFLKLLGLFLVDVVKEFITDNVMLSMFAIRFAVQHVCRHQRTVFGEGITKLRGTVGRSQTSPCPP
jgi:hypothetical protein